MNKSQMYAEVYAVLCTLDDEYLQKIPHSVLNIIADKRDRDMRIKLDENRSLEEQNLSEEAMAFLAMLKFDYWCKNQEEKDELSTLLKMNEAKQISKNKKSVLSTLDKKNKIQELKRKLLLE